MLDWYPGSPCRHPRHWGSNGASPPNAFRKISSLMTDLRGRGSLTLGRQYHAAVIRKESGPGAIPGGLFHIMLTIRSCPSPTRGFVLQGRVHHRDRLGTLASWIVVYGISRARTGPSCLALFASG